MNAKRSVSERAQTGLAPAAQAAAGLALLLLATSAQAIITYDDPNYYVPNPGDFSGTAKLSILRTDGLIETCSGALVAPDKVVTAAHCLTSDGKTPKARSISISFDSVGYGPVTSTRFTWHESWTGDPNTSAADLGVVQLPQAAPANVQPFLVPSGMSIEPPTYVLIAGYGDVGKGGVDPGFPSGYLHVGGNHYDNPAGGLPAGYLYYDFDDYSIANNMLGEPGWITFIGEDGQPVQSIPLIDFEFDGTGVRTEAIIGDGDSGGPSVIDNIFLLGIHSWAKNRAGGDAILLNGLPQGFAGAPGSIAGDVMVGNYAQWIQNAFPSPIPEPASWLHWTLGLAVLFGQGFGRRPAPG